MVKLMIDRGADPDCPVNRDEVSPSTDIGVNLCEGDRPLHVAAKLGRLEIVRLLLNWAGADPNATNKAGRTPLMAGCACLDNRADVVRSLLEAGADATLADDNGYTALHVVGYYGRIDLVDMLYAEAPNTLSRVASTGETPLCIACAQGRENLVTRLLSLGATHPVAGDDRSACALSMAAIKGREGIVRILIDEGLGAVGGGRGQVHGDARRYVHRHPQPPRGSPPDAPRRGLGGAAVGLGEQHHLGQGNASLWSCVHLSRRGERPPRGWSGREGSRLHPTHRSRLHRAGSQSGRIR